MDLRAELLSFLEGSDVELPEDFDDDTPLLSSGLLDSLVLFNLVLWIEEKSGRTIDPTQLDVVRSWDSVRQILGYLQGALPVAPSDGAPARVTPRLDRGLRVVPYSPSYKDAVAKLQTGLWSPDAALNLRYLEWKHEQSPYGRTPRIYLALQGGEPIGMRSFYPTRWQVGTPPREVDVPVADDLLLHEDHRNEGLVTAIMQSAFEDLRRDGVEYVFNLSGGLVTVLGSLAMGWRSAGHLDTVARIPNARRLRTSLRARMASMRFVRRYADAALLRGSAEREPLVRLDAWLEKRVAVAGEPVELSAAPRAADMADLVRRLEYDGRIRHVRDEAFFEWRFRNPLNEYRFLYAGGRVLSGYLVLKWTRASNAPSPRVQIVDLEAASESTLQALLETAIKLGRFPELVTWQATRSPVVVSALRRLRFEAMDGEGAAHGRPCILVRSLEEGRRHEDWALQGMPLLELSSWDMRMLYTMAG